MIMTNDIVQLVLRFLKCIHVSKSISTLMVLNQLNTEHIWKQCYCNDIEIIGFYLIKTFHAFILHLDGLMQINPHQSTVLGVHTVSFFIFIVEVTVCE